MLLVMEFQVVRYPIDSKMLEFQNTQAKIFTRSHLLL